MYLLIVFSDLEQQNIIFTGLFKRIKDIINFSDGLIRYTDSVEQYTSLTHTTHKTIKKLFKIVKL